jgi:hypothetical protein
VIVTPARIAFFYNSYEPALWFLEILVDIIFFGDMVKNFFLGYFDENDQLTMEHPKIIKRYLKTWFPIDLLSSIPFSVILEHSVTARDEMIYGNYYLRL